jgi:hypothetical protein
MCENILISWTYVYPQKFGVLARMLLPRSVAVMADPKCPLVFLASLSVASLKALKEGMEEIISII